MRAHLRPDVKLVYVMRQPVDRLVSHYVHEASRRPMPPVDEAVESMPELVDYGRYAFQLGWLLDSAIGLQPAVDGDQVHRGLCRQKPTPERLRDDVRLGGDAAATSHERRPAGRQVVVGLRDAGVRALLLRLFRVAAIRKHDDLIGRDQEPAGLPETFSSPSASSKPVRYRACSARMPK
jgi:hypothetical protein